MEMFAHERLSGHRRSLLILAEFRMAGDAGCFQWFPAIVLVALHTRNLAMILIKRIPRHGVVIESQVLAFPTFRVVALVANRAQRPLVRVRRGIVTSVTIVSGLAQVRQGRNHGRVVTGVAARSDVFADEQLVVCCVPGNMVCHGALLDPTLREGVTGETGKAVLRGVLYLVT